MTDTRWIETEIRGDPAKIDFLSDRSEWQYAVIDGSFGMYEVVSTEDWNNRVIRRLTSEDGQTPIYEALRQETKEARKNCALWCSGLLKVRWSGMRCDCGARMDCL